MKAIRLTSNERTRRYGIGGRASGLISPDRGDLRADKRVTPTKPDRSARTEVMAELPEAYRETS